ncbi:MAG: hypothetical protein PHD48_09350 [Alphaproteobacteria bacterium]|nr:hypothetical protein [Alphaproteobacteria bacterium]
MTNFIKACLLMALFTFVATTNGLAEDYKPDDMVSFDLSTEGWVSTKTARVALSIEAAVTGNTAGTMRASMTKVVNDIVKADWRLISFNRGQDQTGLERWSAIYEARVSESDLGGLHDKAKKSSKAGMQIIVSDIDFSPTREETEATIALLRTQIFKQANEQLTSLNATIQGRNFRIGSISFGDPIAPQMRRLKSARGAMKMMASASASSDDDFETTPTERAEKITLTAKVIYAAPSTSVSTK